MLKVSNWRWKSLRNSGMRSLTLENPLWMPYNRVIQPFESCTKRKSLNHSNTLMYSKLKVSGTVAIPYKLSLWLLSDSGDFSDLWNDHSYLTVTELLCRDCHWFSLYYFIFFLYIELSTYRFQNRIENSGFAASAFLSQ